MAGLSEIFQFQTEAADDKTCNDMQEVNDLSNILKQEHRKYLKNKVIHDVLEDIVKGKTTLRDELGEKVKRIMHQVSCAQKNLLKSGNLESRYEQNVPLEVVQIDAEELEFTDSDELIKLVVLKANEKLCHLREEFHAMTNRDIAQVMESTEESDDVYLSSTDKTLLDFRKKLLEEQTLYISNLLSLYELLEEITRLRLKNLPEVCKKKIHECEVMSNFHYLRSRMAFEKVNVDIFMESEKCLEAYRKLIDDIKEQQSECLRDIENLKDLKRQYKQVNCKQYDEILKDYVAFLSAIEKKKRLRECKV